jgi:hypothetical protein
MSLLGEQALISAKVVVNMRPSKNKASYAGKDNKNIFHISERKAGKFKTAPLPTFALS